MPILSIQLVMTRSIKHPTKSAPHQTRTGTIQLLWYYSIFITDIFYLLIAFLHRKLWLPQLPQMCANSENKIKCNNRKLSHTHTHAQACTLTHTHTHTLAHKDIYIYICMNKWHVYTYTLIHSLTLFSFCNVYRTRKWNWRPDFQYFLYFLYFKSTYLMC